MSWLKDVVVDIVVTLFIISAIVIGAEWMWWVTIGYTAILAVSKALILIGDENLQLIRKTKTDAPDWFAHLLYFINATALLAAMWWIAAGGWILIWLLSYLAQRRLKSKQGKV